MAFNRVVNNGSIYTRRFKCLVALFMRSQTTFVFIFIHSLLNFFKKILFPCHIHVNMKNSGIDILEESFNCIISNLTKIFVTQEKLDQLKRIFEDQIASARRFENITTMGELLKVLETRNVISCNNIDKLYTIVENIESNDKLRKLLIVHSSWISRLPPPCETLPFYKDFQIHSSVPEFSLPSSVMELISLKITRSWKKFARALEVIPEKDIDSIEKLDFSVRTRKCLELFIAEAVRQALSNPYARLLRALASIGRKDVKEDVEALLTIMFKEK